MVLDTAVRTAGIQSVEAGEIKVELRVEDRAAAVATGMAVAASSKNLSSMDQFRQCRCRAAVGEWE